MPRCDFPQLLRTRGRCGRRARPRHRPGVAPFGTARAARSRLCLRDHRRSRTSGVLRKNGRGDGDSRIDSGHLRRHADAANAGLIARSHHLDTKEARTMETATARNDKAQIRELVSTWMSATKRGDLDALLALMAEDVVFLVPGQEPID